MLHLRAYFPYGIYIPTANVTDFPIGIYIPTANVTDFPIGIYG